MDIIYKRINQASIINRLVVMNRLIIFTANETVNPE